jgi:hypothetical protein
MQEWAFEIYYELLGIFYGLGPIILSVCTKFPEFSLESIQIQAFGVNLKFNSNSVDFEMKC